MRRRDLWVSVTALLPARSAASQGQAPQLTPDQRRAAAEVQRDPILQAMLAELGRMRELRTLPEIPYFVEIGCDDAFLMSVSATLGAAFAPLENRVRPLRVQVRVGSPRFDNTGSIFSDNYSGTRYDSGQLPLEGGVMHYRQALWLAIDRAYKTAVEALGRKTAAMRGVSVADPLPDLGPAPVGPLVRDPVKPRLESTRWRDVVKRLSAVYRNYPAITYSTVDLDVSQGTTYFVSSEGAMVRAPETVAILRTRAGCQAGDGMPLYDGGQWVAPDPGKLPPEAQMAAVVEEVAARLSALTSAPIGATYTGPVLFEPMAAAQLTGEILGTHLCASRRLVAEPGRAVPFLGSEYENRLNSRVMPEWLSVIDDPTLEQWESIPLAGHYLVDLEGVRPERLALIEKGELKTLLTTRQPMRGIPGSNGRARLPGGFGVRTARISNLFVEAGKTAPLAELRTRLLQIAGQLQRPYAMLVRKMDFPSTGSLDDLRRLGQRTAQGGGGRPVSLPLGIYRLYPDGREELVRGLRFRGLGTRPFRDLLAASTERAAFHYADNAAPLALTGAGTYVVGCSVVAPALLFEELELEAIEEEFPEAPLVPAPTSAG